jgi:hypothetical protein
LLNDVDELRCDRSSDAARRIGSPPHPVSDEENSDDAIIRMIRGRRARLAIASDADSDSDERRDRAFRASRSRGHRVAPVVLTDDDDDDA